jgi:hypothetical protein
MLIATPAIAQDTATQFGFSTSTTREIARIPACTEAFADLPRIADRLDVKPGSGISGSMVLTMCDGRQYDFVALLNAFLDKLDKAH